MGHLVTGQDGWAKIRGVGVDLELFSRLNLVSSENAHECLARLLGIA